MCAAILQDIYPLCRQALIGDKLDSDAIWSTDSCVSMAHKRAPIRCRQFSSILPPRVIIRVDDINVAEQGNSSKRSSSHMQDLTAKIQISPQPFPSEQLQQASLPHPCLALLFSFCVFAIGPISLHTSFTPHTHGNAAFMDLNMWGRSCIAEMEALFSVR
ncbi:hypothetical protein FN846DRAFT_687508 [Sphaerosporella brunnea]|uniref:Uncharacterized protein n=1 Tax=Sphaerosporella brunnea TaxID=1250544 RepID=A0A5J5EY88_9PEZI|nr:hypothetical protein FN846DRAFT_687508 [Sphaerosporella brunnea]